MNALIVDDSAFIRRYLKQLLSASGNTCDEAVHGREAIDKLEAGELFDLMLLDVNMPVMDGLACVKAISGSGLKASMKIMMVTTEADNSCIITALDDGADEFLMKPFTPESLREKLLMLGFRSV
jgi:two-component system chemotaxis response regulator CheY